ncbi:glycosyltransferase family 87 protein [Candidatus Uabimicrobium sp. HlEnr_7]|uniref:glycosyltransferase family 87 protein n=1 Tax=Candidatus Uabimicrobium helgolandensis TaxID=3095367 RepID=UPI0035561868
MTTRKTYTTIALLFTAMFVFSTIKVMRKVTDTKKNNRTAFVRWSVFCKKLDNKQALYHPYHIREKLEIKSEYPNLPMMLLILKPFYKMNKILGSLSWMIFKLLWAILIVYVALLYAEKIPNWAKILAVALTFRIFSSDMIHGNVNLFIGGLIALSLLCFYHGKDAYCGLIIGLASVLKITPLLFIPYFIVKKKWRCAAFAMIGIFLFLFVVPSLFLGWEYNNELIVGWGEQMLAPFVSGEVQQMQINHNNQSLTGVFQRLFTDSIAIERGMHKINVLSVSHAQVSLLVKIVCVLLFSLICMYARSTKEQSHIDYLGEFALVFLAMLLMSERTWKHHQILLIFPHVFLLSHFFYSNRKKILYLLVSSFVLHTLSGSFPWGKTLSSFLEAYGAHFWANIILFTTCSMALRKKNGSDQL